MANNLSNYAESELLDHILGTGAYPMPSVFVALYTSDPTDADSGTEVSGGSYARQAVAFDAAAGGASQNAAEIVFPIATANWGTIAYIGLRDAASGGNLLWHGPLTTSKLIETGDQFRIADGELDVSLS